VKEYSEFAWSIAFRTAQIDGYIPKDEVFSMENPYFLKLKEIMDEHESKSKSTES